MKHVNMVLERTAVNDVFVLPAARYVWLGHEIEALEPRVTAGSTLREDLNALLVERRQLWMRMNGLGPL